MTDEQFKIIEQLLTDILAALEKPVTEISAPAPAITQQPDPEKNLGQITTAEIQAVFPRGWPMARDKGKALINVSTSSLEWFLNLPLDEQSRFYESNLQQKALVKRWLTELQRLKKENGGKRPEHLKEAPELPQNQAQEPETEKPIADEIPF